MILQVGVKILIERDSRYLFLRRSQSFKPGPQNWDIPGGRIEPDEPFQDALIREVQEETGLSLEPFTKLLSPQDIFVSEKDIHVVRLTYLGKAHGDIVISDEHDDYKWMTAVQALSEKYLDSYLREVLKADW